MAETLLQTLAPGGLLLVQLRLQGDFHRAAETAIAQVEGEVAIRVTARKSDSAEVSLAWLGLSSLGPPAWTNVLGRLSFGAAGTGAGTIRESADRLDLNLLFTAALSRSSVLKEIDFRTTPDSDLSPSPRELYQGTFSGTIERPPGAANWFFKTGTFLLGPPQDRLSPLLELTFDPAGSAAWSLPAGPQRRRLRIRRVRFKASESSTDTTGVWWNVLLPAAQAVWAKCCIDVIGLAEPFDLVDAGLMTTTDVGAVYAKLPGDLNRVIDVGFVRSDLSSIGGGYTFGGGTANAAVVLSDLAAATNPNLLAHELGHVLNLCHPTCNTKDFAVSESGTVMMVASPNLPRNTQQNCAGIANDGLDTLVGEVCLARPDC
jgi:hypothetical protein